MQETLKHLKTYLTFRHVAVLIFLAVPLLITLVSFITDRSSETTKLGNASYRMNSMQGRCGQGTRSGDAGASDDESTLEGIKFNVRTPQNYDPTLPHPLLMVYSPAGLNRAGTEKTTGLTFEATKAGFIVAYADHPELSPTSTIELGTIPGLIAKKWCVDEQRVFLAGHSDGGTVAMALAFMTGTRHIPKGIAASAAGISRQDLYNRTCPEPLPVMIMHSANDRLFPGYGVDASGWWAACNQCDPIPEKMANGCIAYTGCAKNVKTWYCEGRKPHSEWPAMNGALMDFFTSIGNSGEDPRTKR
jgi:polyhydroxybutyrate depolymerase